MLAILAVMPFITFSHKERCLLSHIWPIWKCHLVRHIQFAFACLFSYIRILYSLFCFLFGWMKSLNVLCWMCDLACPSHSHIVFLLLYLLYHIKVFLCFFFFLFCVCASRRISVLLCHTRAHALDYFINTRICELRISYWNISTISSPCGSGSHTRIHLLGII